MNLQSDNVIWKKAVEAGTVNKLQPLRITSGWKVEWNHFAASNPLQLPKDDFAWVDFSEDMAVFTFNEYTIDLGWYGGLNESGYYGVSIYKHKDLIETFCSNNIDKLTDVLNYFFTIPLQY